MDVNDRDSEDGSAPEGPVRGDDRVAALLRATGRRPPVPPERAERVRRAARAEWIVQTGRRSRRRRIWVAAALAAAATLVAVIGLRRGAEAPAPGKPAVRVERIAGEVWTRATAAGSESPPVRLRADDWLAVGAELATASGGRVAILLSAGPAVRLDANSRVRVVAGRVLALDEGAVYVDSGSALGKPGASIEVRTPLATLRNLGTRYEARLSAGSLLVRVRDGRVERHSGASTDEVSAGQELEVRPDGSVRHRPIDASADFWQWVETVAPMLEIEGRTLGEFADWYARERGIRIRFADPSLAASGPAITLRGSLGDLTLEQALESVLATCGMTSRIEEGDLVIDRAP